jgi:hypothetical protein
MKSDKIDEILAGEEALVPSSGFVASVMDRISQEAALPPPIPFPWKRALPGLAIATLVFGRGTVELVRFWIAASRVLAPPHWQMTPAMERPAEQTAWVALALGSSLLSWLVSRIMTRRSER